MSKRIAILSAIILILGGFSIPGGFVINNIIDDMVTDRTDDGLLGIQEQFIPIASDMILEMGPAVALQIIKKIGTQFGYNLTRASFLTQLLYRAYEVGVYRINISKYGGDALLNMFFDEIEINFHLPFIEDMSFSQSLKDAGIPNTIGAYIYGIAEWYAQSHPGEDLNIGKYILWDAEPNNLLAWGQTDPRWDEDIPPDNDEHCNPPGFMQHTLFGFGILEFLEKFEEADASGSELVKDAFCAAYKEDDDIPFWKFEVVYNYYHDYWLPVALPLLIADLQDPTSPFSQYVPQYVGKNLEDVAYYEFLNQWRCSFAFSSGIDFHDFSDDIPLGTHGLEVNSPTISDDSMYQLWDEFDELSLCNITGVEKWLAANSDIEVKEELEDHFNLTSQEAQDILYWLWDGPDSFSQGALPYLIESELGYGIPLEDLARQLMLEQWANGTVYGMNMFEGGIDFSDFIPNLQEDTTGFEIGVPTPTGMSMESAEFLWDITNPYSLVNDISVWWSITSKDSEIYRTVRDANKLDDNTMDRILDWLPDFRNNLMPILAQFELGLPMDTTDLGNTIQLGGIIAGVIVIGLASTGFVSNAIISKRKQAFYQPDKIKKKNLLSSKKLNLNSQ